MPRPSVPSNLVRPTLDTLFHIDYGWWESAGRDLDLYMSQHLCDEHRAELGDHPDKSTRLDWVDPATGQVLRVDKVQYTLLTHCSLQPDYVTERTSLVDGVFRALLAVGNRPMTPVELAERTSRSADTILRTLSGDEVYRGLRPYVRDARKSRGR